MGGPVQNDRMARRDTGNRVVWAALASNLAIAIIKFVAAALTGSSAMLSEGVHSLVDTINELLLIYGRHRAALPADLAHPFGHGRELYFWSFIVSLLVLSLGAGVSVFEGVSHILHPHPLSHPLANYVVLAVAFVVEGVSWWIALRAFRAAQGSLGLYEAFRRSKDPTTFTVLFEDSAALLGVLIAFVGIASAQHWNMPMLDGVASVLIGCVLAASSLLLARETKDLLLGEAAHPKVRDAILRIAGDDPGIRCANGVITVQMGPDTVVASLSAEFEDALDTTAIEQCVNRIEVAVQAAHPSVRMLFVKPQTAATWRERTIGLH